MPEMTVQVARAAFPRGNPYLRFRDELGTLYTDEDFAALYPRCGQPAWSPWQLALVTVLQFAENLSDRQAAEAVRARIDWKYLLGLELSDPGFHYSILCEFRKRLIEGEAETLLLERLLEQFTAKKLLKARGRQRTDSTHVLAAIRTMNRLELVTETLRATLNELATVAPDWLRTIGPAEWYDRYRQRAEESRLPKGAPARREFAETVARDGETLIQALEDQPHLRSLPKVTVLRQVWERHFVRSAVEAGAPLTWRAEADLPRAAEAIESPYDPEARYSTKRDLAWTGYKVHVTETCDPDLPRLITDVQTTEATTQDVSCTAAIQQSLAERELLPSRQLVDAGYVDAELLVSSREQHEIELFGPTRLNPSWQTRTGGYDQSQFHLDWEQQQATCPEGKQSVSWHESKTKTYENPVVYVRFAAPDCAACPSRSQCVRSAAGRPRTLLLRSRAQQEALEQARAQMSTKAGQREYQQRAGIEGTLSQGVRRSGLRRTRYRGLQKTQLQHVATATALNLVRAVNYLAEVPWSLTRTSRFAQLAA
jgi:transposase